MIIKTIRPHANARKLGRYLTHESKDNEQVADRGTRGTFATDTTGALLEMAATRHGSRCQQPLYHVVFNAAKGEQLSPEQWEQAMGMWEKEMGLSGHQRAVVQHLKDGRWHTHAVWNRIDPETGKAVSIGRDHFAAKKVSREIERELNLKPVHDKPAGRRRGQQPPLKWETEQTRRTKADPKKIREQIAESWALSDSGQSFQHALKERDLTLARGERRPFIVLDRDGNMFALSGRVLPHARMKDIKSKLHDLNRDELPGVNEERQNAKQRKAERRRSPSPEREASDTTGKAGNASGKNKSGSHEIHRKEHAALNRKATETEERHAKEKQELEKSHQRELQQLNEKQRDRWWHKAVGKSRKRREQEAKQRERLSAQQKRDMAELEKRKLKELQTIEARRTQLREQEKRERSLEQRFTEQQRRPTPEFEKAAAPPAPWKAPLTHRDPARSAMPEHDQRKRRPRP